MSSAPSFASSNPPNQLTIEQLAAESGMSVRNIRAHQARGLLHPPEVRARVGYYGPEHVEQLRLIRDLQEDGFNLGAIKRLIDDSQGTAERLQRFGAALSAAATTERGETLTLEELGRRFRVSAHEAPEVLAEAERLGVLIPIGDDRYRAPSPSLLAIAQGIVARGISLHSALAILEDIDRHCDSVSRSLVALFVDEIWKPFAQADMPAERWPEIEHALERLGPVASEALMAIFQRRLSAQLEGAFQEITRRVAERTADPSE
ncbi:MAG: MerR family transcriptional regulator [Solirubrobacterales bacterium]|nr:MerR family transcriptional regulator [Solirubrobacterales bacterium]